MESVCYGDKKIEFKLTRKDVKNINLRIKPNQDILVSANSAIPLEDIKEFVSSKGKWIERKLSYYEKTSYINQIEKEYVNGETFRYLGKQYRLKVFESDENKVKYFRGYIHIYTSDLGNRNKKEALLEKWYEDRAKIIFKESLDRMYQLVKAHGIEYPHIDIRKMKSRWGSCHIKNNKIVLNSILIKAPKDCIDHVVLHELIHFKYRNHGENFYKLLNILMPDWKDKKKILDEVIVMEL